jgi:hypothetical protein
VQRQTTPVRLAASQAGHLTPGHGVRNRGPPELRDGLPGPAPRCICRRGAALAEGIEMEAILSMLGAVMLVLVSLAAVLGLVILVLHETRYIIRLSVRLGDCATHAARRQQT